MKLKKSNLGVIYFAIAMALLFTVLWFSFDRENLNNNLNKRIRVQLQWFDGPQFMGLYMAKEKGYFDEEGLDIVLIEGGYTTNPFDRIFSDRADIGIATGDQILIRKSNGDSLKAIGTVFNKSMGSFIAKQDVMKNFTDIIGKNVGVYKNYDTENILLSMLYNEDIAREKVNIVQAGNIESFFKGDINVFPSYRFNEPVIAEQRGINIKQFLPENKGVFFYSDTFFCEEKYLSENRETIIKFLRAVIRGWDYSTSNPDESLDVLINSLASMTEENREKAQQQLKIIFQNIGSGNNGTPLFMEKLRWLKMEKMLFKIGKIKSLGNIEALCDFDIINETELNEK